MASNKNKKPAVASEAPKKSRFVYIGSIVILVIVVLAFVVAPALGGGASQADELTLGYWKSTPIAFAQNSYFSGQVQQLKTQYEQQGYKDTGNAEFARLVWRRAFENTVIHFALLDYAKKYGMSVSSDYIDAEMLKNPRFLDNGVFSKKLYRETPNTAKAELRNNISTASLKNRYVTDATGYMISKNEIDFIKKISTERRVVQYVSFPFSAYPDSEVVAYAKENPALFKSLSLSQISISLSKKDAEKVLEQIKSGVMSFEDAAKNHSKDSYAANGGSVGKKFAWELASELKNKAEVDAVLSLPAGAMSSVYETAAGVWVFFKANDAASEPNFTSDELIKAAKTYITQNEKGRIENWAVEKANVFLAMANANGFDKAASSAALTIKETKAFPLNYGSALTVGGYFPLIGSLDTQGLPELQGADTNEQFLSAVFKADKGQVLKPQIMYDNVLVVMVKDTTSATSEELTQIDNYYKAILEQDISNDIVDSILKSPNLKDNFNAVFTKLFFKNDQ